MHISINHCLGSVRILFYILPTILLLGCGSVKIQEVVEREEMQGLNGQSILVIVKSSRPEVRSIFEDELTRKLQAKGLKVSPSYKSLPELNLEGELTEERKREIRAMVEAKGYDGGVVTVLRLYQERTRTVGDGGYDVPVSYGMNTTMGPWGDSFFTYFYFSWSYNTDFVFREESEDTITARYYYVDTASFDLNRPEGKQLVRIVRTEIENPDGARATAKEYAAKVVKEITR